MNPTDTRSAVAAEMRAALARAGRTASWLAERTQISKQALSRKLRGDTSFTVEELVSASVALDVDPSTLVPGAHKVAA